MFRISSVDPGATLRLASYGKRHPCSSWCQERLPAEEGGEGVCGFEDMPPFCLLFSKSRLARRLPAVLRVEAGRLLLQPGVRAPWLEGEFQTCAYTLCDCVSFKSKHWCRVVAKLSESESERRKAIKKFRDFDLGLHVTRYTLHVTQLHVHVTRHTSHHTLLLVTITTTTLSLLHSYTIHVTRYTATCYMHVHV